MARFDVYRNEDGGGYLLDIQADILRDLNTRVVVPLMRPKNAPIPAKRLNPTFQVSDETVVMVSQFMAAVPVAILRNPVTSLEPHRTEIVDAVDMLTQGF